MNKRKADSSLLNDSNEEMKSNEQIEENEINRDIELDFLVAKKFAFEEYGRAQNMKPEDIEYASQSGLNNEFNEQVFNA